MRMHKCFSCGLTYHVSDEITLSPLYKKGDKAIIKICPVCNFPGYDIVDIDDNIIMENRLDY